MEPYEASERKIAWNETEKVKHTPGPNKDYIYWLLYYHVTAAELKEQLWRKAWKIGM